MTLVYSDRTIHTMFPQKRMIDEGDWMKTIEHLNAGCEDIIQTLYLRGVKPQNTFAVTRTEIMYSLIICRSLGSVF